MEGNIIQLKEYHLNKGTSKDHTPVFPMTKASAIEGMAELLKDLNINGVTPTSDISDVNSPEKGKIYYEESTDKYYVYSEDKSSFVELGAGASVDPSDVMPTVTQTTSSEQSGGDNIITFTFPNGETTQVVIKNGQQGAQGNSGYTGAAGELEVVNNLKDGGATAALSAEMGKKLAEQTVVRRGTFAQAFFYASGKTVFPWLLIDTDKQGNPVKKMIWHVGDRKFVDAVGAEVDWYKNCVVIDAVEPFILMLSSRCQGFGSYTTFNANQCVKKEVSAGLNVFTFEELKPNHSNLGECARIWFFDTTENHNVTTKKIKAVDFGGLKTAMPPSFQYDTVIESISGLVIEDVTESINNGYTTSVGMVNNWCQGATKLSYIEVRGNCPAINGSTLLAGNAPGVFDYSNLTLKSGIVKALSDSVVDIRSMILGEGAVFATANLCDLHNVTFIIGSFDTSSITSASGFLDRTDNLEIVCTTTTPPAANSDNIVLNGKDVLSNILDKTTTIKVPVAALSAYQSAEVWENYVDKMDTYEEGEY